MVDGTADPTRDGSPEGSLSAACFQGLAFGAYSVALDWSRKDSGVFASARTSGSFDGPNEIVAPFATPETPGGTDPAV